MKFFVFKLFVPKVTVFVLAFVLTYGPVGSNRVYGHTIDEGDEDAILFLKSSTDGLIVEMDEASVTLQVDENGDSFVGDSEETAEQTLSSNHMNSKGDQFIESSEETSEIVLDAQSLDSTKFGTEVSSNSVNQVFSNLSNETSSSQASVNINGSKVGVGKSTDAEDSGGDIQDGRENQKGLLNLEAEEASSLPPNGINAVHGDLPQSTEFKDGTVSESAQTHSGEYYAEHHEGTGVPSSGFPYEEVTDGSEHSNAVDEVNVIKKGDDITESPESVEPILIPDNEDHIDDSARLHVIDSRQLQMSAAKKLQDHEIKDSKQIMMGESKLPSMAGVQSKNDQSDLSSFLVIGGALQNILEGFFGIFPLIQSLLLVFVSLLSMIFILWFRFKKVISAVHGSKGRLFFETPKSLVDDWSGMPGAHCRPVKKEKKAHASSEKRSSLRPPKFEHFFEKESEGVVSVADDIQHQVLPNRSSEKSQEEEQIKTIKKKRKRKKKRAEKPVVGSTPSSIDDRLSRLVRESNGLSQIYSPSTYLKNEKA